MPSLTTHLLALAIEKIKYSFCWRVSLWEGPFTLTYIGPLPSSRTQCNSFCFCWYVILKIKFKGMYFTTLQNGSLFYSPSKHWFESIEESTRETYLKSGYVLGQLFPHYVFLPIISYGILKMIRIILHGNCYLVQESLHLYKQRCVIAYAFVM